jgi:hypothetical protein
VLTLAGVDRSTSSVTVAAERTRLPKVHGAFSRGPDPRPGPRPGSPRREGDGDVQGAGGGFGDSEGVGAPLRGRVMQEVPASPRPRAVRSEGCLGRGVAHEHYL